jgi:hypothetical protein
LDINNFNKEDLLCKLKDLRDNKKAVVFTNAFTVSSFGYMDESIPKDKVTRSVECIAELHKLLVANNRQMLREMEQKKDSAFTYNSILKFYGIGPFLAYQIAVDIGYHFPQVYDESSHVVAGPGCKRGLSNLFIDPGKMTEHEQMQWLVNDQERGLQAAGENVDELFSDQPLKHRRLNLMAIENCLCEISKYLKAYRGSGRPRNRYMGAQTAEQQQEIEKRFRLAHPTIPKAPKQGPSKKKSKHVTHGNPTKKRKRFPVGEIDRKKSPIRRKKKATQPRAIKAPVQPSVQTRTRSGNRRVSRKRRK